MLPAEGKQTTWRIAMALQSLRFDAYSNVSETRGGVYIYDGAASRFHEWEFRTTVRKNATKKEELPKAVNSIVESLRGDAAQVAMDLGPEKLAEEDGIKQLIDAMRHRVFPLARQEAKELYRAGHSRKGHLSRQPTESTINFTSRRRRWWKELKKMDPSISLSDSILGDLMLESAGLTEDQQKMVLTSTGNCRDFEKIAEALVDQYPTMHMNERGGKHHDDQKNYQGGKGRKGKGKPWKSYAHLAEEQNDSQEESSQDHEEDEEDDDDWYAREKTAFVANAEEDGDETLEEFELDVFTALICQSTEEKEEPWMASVLQAETSAFLAWKKAPKGKGKGKSKKGRPRYSQGLKPRLSLEQRKEALKRLKAKTKCKACGAPGHWANDPECPRTKKSGNLAIDEAQALLDEINLNVGEAATDNVPDTRLIKPEVKATPIICAHGRHRSPIDLKAAYASGSNTPQRKCLENCQAAPGDCKNRCGKVHNRHDDDDDEHFCEDHSCKNLPTNDDPEDDDEDELPPRAVEHYDISSEDEEPGEAWVRRIYENPTTENPEDKFTARTIIP